MNPPIDLIDSLLRREPQSDFVWQHWPEAAAHITAERVRAAATETPDHAG